MKIQHEITNNRSLFMGIAFLACVFPFAKLKQIKSF